MKRLFLTFLVSAPLFAHGGQYRGPGDVVPPQAGRPNGPTTPGRPGTPGVPTTPSRPTNPNTPFTPGIPGQPGSPSTPGTMTLTVPTTSWTFWWEFNKDRFLKLKERKIKVSPTTEGDEFHIGFKKYGDDRILISRELKFEIYQTMKDVLLKDSQVDETSSALVGIAKIGLFPEESLELISKYLKDKNQEIRETATVSLGILGSPLAIDTLSHLLKDNMTGRRLVNDREVDLRTRAFAAYGLGLIGHGLQGDLGEIYRHQIEETLLFAFTSDRSAIKDVKIGCIIGLGLTKDVRTENVLLDYLKDKKNDDLVRAHIPWALSQFRKDHSDLMIRILRDKNEAKYVRLAALLSLGSMPAHSYVVKEVIKLQDKGKSLHEKYLTAIVLGQLGTDEAVEFLLKSLKGKKIYRPWAALGLGICYYNSKSVDPKVPELIRRVLVQEKDPAKIGAYAIALGLMKNKAQDMIPVFVDARTQEAKGYTALGLGLSGIGKDVMRKALLESKRKPLQLQQISIGLGIMGDPKLVSTLIDQLKQARTTAVYAAISQALGFIGDATSVQPLIAVVKDDKITGEARAFAIVALGIIADKEKLPWNEKIARNINYIASVPTLTGGSVGILDIL